MVIISSRGFTSVPGGGPLRGPFWPFVPLLSGRSMEMKSRCMTSAILWVLAAAATAAGSSVGVPLPGLKADEGSNVSARSCSVTLVGDKATVELELAATSEQPALLIDGPLFGWLGGSEAYPDRHFPELEVDIDGTKVAPDLVLRRTQQELEFGPPAQLTEQSGHHRPPELRGYLTKV